MKNYRSFLLVSLLIISHLTVFGQKRNHGKGINRAVIQYNDGSVFIGKIVEENGLTMSVVIATEDTIHLNKAYIKRIKRNGKNILLHDSAKFHYTKGRFFSLQFGAGMSDEDHETMQLEFLAGYRFNKKISAALGVGAAYNSTFFAGNWIETDALPIFAYARYYPFDKKVRPFLSAKLGWSIPNTQSFAGNHDGGMLFQPEIGIHFASRRKVRFLLALGQQLQNIKGTDTEFDVFGNPISSKFNFWFNRTVLKLGIEWR